MRRRWLGLIVPVVLLLVWEAIWHAEALHMESLSRPWEVAIALCQGLLNGSILLLTLQTFESALFGFAIAAVIGVTVGIFLGLVPRAERVVGPSVDLLRPVPSVALIPLALMIYGFGVRMEASIVAFACVWPILIISTAAVRSIEPGLLEVARVLQMTATERTFKIVLPAAAGRIAVGLQLALAISLVVAVTVEIVINPRGLGYGMMSAQQAMQFDKMYAQLLWIGVVGWGLSFISQKLLDRWSPAFQAARKESQS